MKDIRFELPEINTWRLFGKAVTQPGVMEMVEAWESHGYRFGCVTIDDGWMVDGRMGDWMPDPSRFPDLAGLVELIHAKGYAVRLWVAPLQIHEGTKAFERLGSSCLLKDKHGKPAYFVGLGTCRLDPRKKEAQDHIRGIMQRLIRDYHVDAFKVDFPPFYTPKDEWYIEQAFDFSERDNKTMVPNFYRLVRESIDAVNPSVRVECAKNLPGCQPYVNDTIAGDFIGQQRTLKVMSEHAACLKEYAAGNDMVPWLEMVWGEGSDTPNLSSEWCSGYLENMAASINFGLKLEHGFQPFSYPNAGQIRAVNNLYGPRHSVCKVLCAGRKCWTVTELREAGVETDHASRFLIAPEKDVNVVLHTAALGTSALQWHCRNVLSGAPVRMRARNEFWGGTTDWCRVEVDAPGGQVYELWHEGRPDDSFRRQFQKHCQK